MSKARWFFPAVAFCLFSLVSYAAQLLSIDATGTHSGNFGIGEPFAISDDGRFAAFTSRSTNHVANDTNTSADVFVHDCVLRKHVWDTTHALSAVSPASGGSTPWAFTPDGRYLLFVSTATNLVPGIATSSINAYQLYLQDLLSNVITLITVSYDGTAPANRSIGSFPNPRTHSISSDGQFVAFATIASNLVSFDNNNNHDVFCRDVLNGTTEMITVAPSGDRPIDAYTFSFLMSTNGRFFAFETPAGDAIGGMTNTARTLQVYWRDRLARTNSLVTVTLDGGFATSSGNSLFADMSRDGRYVCFRSFATNLVANQNEAGSGYNLFIRDMFLGETWLASPRTSGILGDVNGGQFSDNGRVVIFTAFASGGVNIFAHNLAERATTMVSASWQGNSGADSYASDGFANISATGRFVLFTCSAGNLIPGYTNRVQRLYLRDLDTGRTLDPLRSPYFPTPSFNYGHTAISADERYIFFMTDTNFDNSITDTNKTIDLFRAPLYEPKFLTANPLVADALPNATYVLEASSNLSQWSPMQTNTANGQGRVTFTDSFSAPQRFYRTLAP